MKPPSRLHCSNFALLQCWLLLSFLLPLFTCLFLFSFVVKTRTFLVRLSSVEFFIFYFFFCVARPLFIPRGFVLGRSCTRTCTKFFSFWRDRSERKFLVATFNHYIFLFLAIINARTCASVFKIWMMGKTSFTFIPQEGKKFFRSKRILTMLITWNYRQLPLLLILPGYSWFQRLAWVKSFKAIISILSFISDDNKLV